MGRVPFRGEEQSAYDGDSLARGCAAQDIEVLRRESKREQEETQCEAGVEGGRLAVRSMHLFQRTRRPSMRYL